jgi:hypothetical protein
MFIGRGRVSARERDQRLPAGTGDGSDTGGAGHRRPVSASRRGATPSGEHVVTLKSALLMSAIDRALAAPATSTSYGGSSTRSSVTIARCCVITASRRANVSSQFTRFLVVPQTVAVTS